MTVSTVPHRQDLRVRPQPQYSGRHFHFNINDFPALPKQIAVDLAPSMYEESKQSPGTVLIASSAIEPTSRMTKVSEEPMDPASLPVFSRFMELPVELREVIWDYTMRGMVHAGDIFGNMTAAYLVTPVEIREFLKAPNNPERPNFLPPLCRVSKSTRTETIGAYLRGSKFMVASFPDNRLLDSFLQTVAKGYETIRSIHFAFFDCFPGPEKFAQNADLELSVRCTGLHTVKLTFHMSRLSDSLKSTPYDDCEIYPRSVDEMWVYYKFVRLLDCEKLKNIDIQRKGRAVEAGFIVSEELGARIEKEYNEKHSSGMRVTYSCF